jgi:hypothetical protein
VKAAAAAVIGHLDRVKGLPDGASAAPLTRMQIPEPRIRLQDVMRIAALVGGVLAAGLVVEAVAIWVFAALSGDR